MCRLADPEVRYENGKIPDPALVGGPTLKGWNLRNRQFLHSFQGTFRWAVLSIRNENFHHTNNNNYNDFCKSFKDSLRYAGITGGTQYMPAEKDDFLDISKGSKENIKDKLQQVKNNWNVRLLIVLLPGKSVENYQSVKRHADMLSLPTVCVAAEQDGLVKSSSQFTGNLVMKANLKLSRDTINHTTTSLLAEDDSKRPLLFTMKTMILGLDVVSSADNLVDSLLNFVDSPPKSGCHEESS